VQLQQSRALRVVIALTKCDLVPAGTFERWRDCLGGASAESADSADSASAGGMLGALAPIVVRFDAPHATFVGDHVKLGPRRKLLKQRRGAVARGEWCPSVAPLLEACGIDVGSLGTDSAGAAPSSPRDPADTVDIGVLPTITLLGQPSVGKSSVLNALMAAKVASVSLTAGHTKILQTHIVRRHAHSTPLAVVCDSPGLVFPRAAAEAPRALLEIAGSLMTAQVREPYSAIRLLVERFDLDLPRLYGLPATPTDAYDDAAEYTPFVLCEELAAKRQWRVARSGRADAHRAGLQIIKDAASGVIPWCC
jgi:ribosome biogenesis GTPase A